MRGLWLESRVLRAREDVPRPGAAPGEALVRVSLTGVCGTDLELVKGYYPFAGVPGHEFVGRIEGGARDGERVVGEINASCGRCATCRAGRRTHCPTRTVLGIKARNGAMAEWLTLPLENLHAVPDHVPDEVAVFTEPVAAALQVQEQVAIGSGTRVLVIGAGRLGQLVARTLARADCVLTASGRHPRKLALLSELGIATCDVRDVPAGAADVVVECTGNPEGLALATSAVGAKCPIQQHAAHGTESSTEHGRPQTPDRRETCRGRGHDRSDKTRGQPPTPSPPAIDVAWLPGVRWRRCRDSNRGGRSAARGLKRAAGFRLWSPWVFHVLPPTQSPKGW